MSKDNIQIEINIPRQTAENYLQANREIEQRLGMAPGAGVLMALTLEGQNTAELVEEYCEVILGTPVS